MAGQVKQRAPQVPAEKVIKTIRAGIKAGHSVQQMADNAGFQNKGSFNVRATQLRKQMGYFNPDNPKERLPYGAENVPDNYELFVPLFGGSGRRGQSVEDLQAIALEAAGIEVDD